MAVINSQSPLAEQEEDRRRMLDLIMQNHLAQQELLLDDMRMCMGLNARGRLVA